MAIFIYFLIPIYSVGYPLFTIIVMRRIWLPRLQLIAETEKLAEKAELHHNYIGDIERGEENVSVDALMRIAIALKVRLSDLVRDA